MCPWAFRVGLWVILARSFRDRVGAVGRPDVLALVGLDHRFVFTLSLVCASVVFALVLVGVSIRLWTFKTPSTSKPMDA